MFRALIITTALTITMNAAVKIEKIQYRGWPNCYRISNGEADLIITTDVGPRILRYGFVAGQNLFKEFDAQLGHAGESTWQARGGHRVWMAPEDSVLTYALDNSPIHFEQKGDTVVLTGNVEKETGLQKQIAVTLAPTGTGVEIVHRITNRAKQPREFAIWALTMMAEGGTGIVAFPPRGKHPEVLLPTNPLVMWAFTDFSDPRWKFTQKYLILRQDPKIAAPQKTGLFNTNTIAAYLLGSDLFMKRSSATDARKQPDYGCSYETFTNNEFLEMETLGVLGRVAPGQSVEHVEHWSLHRDVKIPSWTDADLDAALLHLIR
jgi:hypothetical protein